MTNEYLNSTVKYLARVHDAVFDFATNASIGIDHPSSGAFFSKVPARTFGPEKPVVKLQSACFEKLAFCKKNKRIAKFDCLEPRRCEDIKGILALEIDPKVSGLSRNRPLAPVVHTVIALCDG